MNLEGTWVRLDGRGMMTFDLASGLLTAVNHDGQQAIFNFVVLEAAGRTVTIEAGHPELASESLIMICLVQEDGLLKIIVQDEEILLKRL